MTFFENELIKMFGKNEAMTDIRCIANTLVGRLTPDTIAKISFSKTINQGEYPGVLIRVIDPKRGEIDKQSINFCDAFGRLRKENIHIYDSGDGITCWHGFSPSRQDYEDINLSAQQYLEMFLEPVQDMGLSI